MSNETHKDRQRERARERENESIDREKNKIVQPYRRHDKKAKEKDRREKFRLAFLARPYASMLAESGVNPTWMACDSTR